MPDNDQQSREVDHRIEALRRNIGLYRQSLNNKSAIFLVSTLGLYSMDKHPTLRLFAILLIFAFFIYEMREFMKEYAIGNFQEEVGNIRSEIEALTEQKDIAVLTYKLDQLADDKLHDNFWLHFRDNGWPFISTMVFFALTLAFL